MGAFAKSVLLGTVTGAAPVCSITFPIALAFAVDGGGGDLLPSVWLALLPVVVTFPLVLGASIVFGLPLTALLKRLDAEAGTTYAACGAAIGFVIPIAILLTMRAPTGYWTAALGAVSGAITALSWWRSARKPRAADHP